MLFSNLNKNNFALPLNEGNFISKDLFGLFDSDAEFRLSSLTIDKLFEGLDLEKSDNLHNYIISNMPSLKDVLGKNKADNTSAFEILRAQVMYIQQKIEQYDRELSSAFSSVIKATKYAKNPELAKETITKMTGPEGISSIIPKIDQAVLNAKNRGYNFSDQRLQNAFDSLYKLKVSDIIQGVILSLEESAKNTGLKAIYQKIDLFELKEIEADSAKLEPKIYTNGTKPNIDLLLKSDNIYDRLAGFYEEVLLQYPFGRNMRKNFGDSYETIINGSFGLASIRQFVPSIDFSAFEPIETLLDEISATLINRVYADSPYETIKNICIPSLQMMYAGVLSLLAMKLINYNISVEKQMVAKQEEVKKSAEDVKKNRVIALKTAMDNLDRLNFFISDKVYRITATGMNSDIIKEINNFLVNLELLPLTSKDSIIFDDKTENAVKKMQSNQGVKVDGAIGNQTREVMKQLTKFFINKYQIT